MHVTIGGGKPGQVIQHLGAQRLPVDIGEQAPCRGQVVRRKCGNSALEKDSLAAREARGAGAARPGNPSSLGDGHPG